MPITTDDVDKIAKLAKLEFSLAEKEKFTEQLDQIVDYVEKLNELNTEDVVPTSHVLDIKNVMREDTVKPWLSQEEALANAPAKKMGCFCVPKVIGDN